MLWPQQTSVTRSRNDPALAIRDCATAQMHCIAGKGAVCYSSRGALSIRNFSPVQWPSLPESTCAIAHIALCSIPHLSQPSYNFTQNLYHKTRLFGRLMHRSKSMSLPGSVHCSVQLHDPTSINTHILLATYTKDLSYCQAKWKCFVAKQCQIVTSTGVPEMRPVNTPRDLELRNFYFCFWSLSSLPNHGGLKPN